MFSEQGEIQEAQAVPILRQARQHQCKRRAGLRYTPALTTPAGSTTQPRRAREFDAAFTILRDAIAARVFPGAAFGVLHGGEIIAIEAVGCHTYATGATPVAPDTVFDIASITKVLATTSLAMLLWQEDAAMLDIPLARVLPGFASLPDARRQQVTLGMLLAHTSGLPAHRRLYESAEVATAVTPGAKSLAAVEVCMQSALERTPGEAEEYSDLGFILLGEALVQLAGGVDLQQQFMERVARPLGLRATGYRPGAGVANNIAPNCDWRWRHRCFQGEVQDENCAVLGGIAGHAGLFSTCEDLLRFSQEMLEPGELFAAEAVERFSRRVAGARALGWDTPSQPSQSGQYFSSGTIGHLGYTGTSVWIDREQDIAIVLLTNRTYTGPEARPMAKPAAIQRVRPAFHDAVMRSLPGR